MTSRIRRCTHYWPGWYCDRPWNHVGGCRPRPVWWNVVGHVIVLSDRVTGWALDRQLRKMEQDDVDRRP